MLPRSDLDALSLQTGHVTFKGVTSRIESVSVSPKPIEDSPSLRSEAQGPPLPVHTPRLHQYLSRTASEYADRVALVSVHQPQDFIPLQFPNRINQVAGGHQNYLRWTPAQLQHVAEILVIELKARGVKKGQPIATFLYTSAGWSICVRTTAALGCPFVSLNPKTVMNIRDGALVEGFWSSDHRRNKCPNFQQARRKLNRTYVGSGPEDSFNRIPDFRKLDQIFKPSRQVKRNGTRFCTSRERGGLSFEHFH